MLFSFLNFRLKHILNGYKVKRKQTKKKKHTSVNHVFSSRADSQLDTVTTTSGSAMRPPLIFFTPNTQKRSEIPEGKYPWERNKRVIVALEEENMWKGGRNHSCRDEQNHQRNWTIVLGILHWETGVWCCVFLMELSYSGNYWCLTWE